MPLGVTLNNPGNLTVTGPNSYVYAGQTGVQSANGLFYAVFASAQDGANALITWLQNNIGSNDATSLTTPSELTSYYLNGSFGPLTNTANNPNANNYLTSLEQSTGLGPNGSLTSVPINTIAAGIQKAEGNMGLGNLFSAQTTPEVGTVGSGSSGGIIGNLLTAGQQELNNFGTGAAYISQNGPFAGLAALMAPQTAAGINAATANPAASLASSSGLSNLFAPLIAWFNSQEQGFEAAIPNAIERWAFGIVAVVLIIAGIWFLVSSGNKQQINISPGLAAAALA